jgi:hypothetical protein
MKMHFLSYLFVFTLLGCHAAENINKQSINSHEKSTCPIIKSDKWHAWIDKATINKQLFRLNIHGEVELPNSGYQITWLRGPMDRMQPPKLSVNIVPQKREGMSLQVLSTMPVTYTLETPIKNFRAVAIYCGGELLTEMVDIQLTN